MNFYYTKNDELVRSKVNRTYADLYTLSPKEFERWVNELCKEVITQWDQYGKPPMGGVKLEDMGTEFERACKVDVSKMFFKDEQTRDYSCVMDGARIGVANNFFPNILKAGDSVGNTASVSVYDLFAKTECRARLMDVMNRSLLKDGFSEFAPTYKVASSFKGDLRRAARQLVKNLLEEEAAGIGERSFWIEPAKKIEKRLPRISVKELRAFKAEGLLKDKHLNGTDIDAEPDDAMYKLRIYGIRKKAKKVLPSLFSLMRLSGIHAPSNFPVGIARLLYSYATERCKDQKEIVIYDPSMGFGARALAAMSLRDRPIRYLGTDPNTENWIKELGISRYEYMERVFKSHVRYGSEYKGTYICSGSEDVSQNSQFKKYKGKIDFIFTSPPYFSAEIYCDEPTQSTVKFKDYETWRDGFLRPTLQTCADWLKADRNLAFNIADINIGSTQYPLEDDLVNILKDCGLEFVGKLKMVIAKSPAMIVKKEIGQPGSKNLCKLNGKWRKYEPIFVFYKKP